jgi:hypothetical protein
MKENVQTFPPSSRHIPAKHENKIFALVIIGMDFFGHDHNM